VIEGGAEFAALDLYRSTGPQDDTSDDWFARPGIGLAQGDPYGAWPLYETYREQFDGDPYAVIEIMIQAGANHPGSPPASILQAAGLDNAVFASLWTSASLRSTAFNDPSWEVNWPGLNLQHGPHDTAYDKAEHGIGQFYVEGLGGFAHLQYNVPFSSDVQVVAVTPNGGPMMTHADSGTITIADHTQQWFCVAADPKVCTCPDGLDPNVDFTNLTGPMLFSFGAQEDPVGAGVEATTFDPNRFCVTKPLTNPREDTGSAAGDPHMTTFNGLNYDFMNLGEFVTTSDPQGGLTVQERHQPLVLPHGGGAVALEDDRLRTDNVAGGRHRADALEVLPTLLIGQPGDLERAVGLDESAGVVVNGFAGAGQEAGGGVVVAQDHL
jgi:hypothetical protein